MLRTAANYARKLGVNYLWGALNFGVGAVVGATLAFAALIGVLAQHGLL